MTYTTRFAQNEQDTETWNQLVKSCRNTSFFVLSYWMESYKDFGCEIKYFLCYEGDRLVGGAGIIMYRLSILKWLQVSHGPFVTGPEHKPAIAVMLRDLEQFARSTKAAFIQVEPYERALPGPAVEQQAARFDVTYNPLLPGCDDMNIAGTLLENGYKKQTLSQLIPVPKEGLIVDLTAPNLLKSYRERSTRYIKSTLKNELVKTKEISTLEDLEVAYKLFCDTAESYNFTFRPWANIRDSYWPAIQKGYMRGLICYYDNEPMAANVVTFGGNRVVYTAGGVSRKEIDSIRPAHLIQYLAMQHAQEQGYTEYDLTSPVGGGVLVFKKSFSPQYYHLGDNYSKIVTPFYGTLYKIIQPPMVKYRRQLAWLYYKLLRK